MKKERNEIAIRCAYGEMVAIDALKPHPKNPNHHPPKQIALLARLIRRVGMRQPITVSNLSGYIVRGHGRLEACRALKMAEVPVDFQDYADEAEEMADLLADNRIPELAELDLSAAWKNLGDIAGAFKLEDLGFMKSEFKDVNLQQLLEEPINAEVAEAVAPPKEAEIYETSIKPTHFPSSSKWGIPDIRADRIPCGFEVSGIRCNREDEIRPGMLFLWGSNKFPDDCKRGVVGFYVDDVRFADLCYEFDEMVKAGEFIKAHNFAAAISPNLSLWRGMPHALLLYRTYLVRYVSRLWQEMGIDVIPDINWADEQSYEYCFDGIPKNAPIASIQCRTTNAGTSLFAESKKFFLKGLRTALERLAPEKLLIYGGVRNRKWIEPNVDFGRTVPVWLDMWEIHDKGGRGRKTKNGGGN